MSLLPKISNTEVTKTVKFGDRIYVVRPWKTRDERNFMIKQTTLPADVQNDEIKMQEILIEELIIPCIVDGDIDKLSFNEVKKLILDIRCMSIGGEIENFNFKCASCGTQNMGVVNIEEEGVVTFKEANTELQSVTDKLQVRFKPIPYRSIFRNIKDEMSIVYSSIDEIVYEGQSYKDFTKDDFIEFFDSLDIMTSKKLMGSLESSLDSLNIVGKLGCFKCGGITSVNFDDLPNFIMP